jgi:hypothetical protein
MILKGRSNGELEQRGNDGLRPMHHERRLSELISRDIQRDSREGGKETQAQKASEESGGRQGGRNGTERREVKNSHPMWDVPSAM